MKLKITEAAPGELAERAPEIVRALERLTGRELLARALEAPMPPLPDPLVKAESQKLEAGTALPVTFAHPVLQSTLQRSAKQAKRIRKLMEARFAEVLEG